VNELDLGRLEALLEVVRDAPEPMLDHLASAERPSL
jgi:hypothetical protein